MAVWSITVTPNTGAAYQGGGRRRAGSVHVLAKSGQRIINLDVMPDELDTLDLDEAWANVWNNRKVR
jgi:hypothetical protein